MPDEAAAPDNGQTTESENREAPLPPGSSAPDQAETWYPPPGHLPPAYPPAAYPPPSYPPPAYPPPGYQPPVYPPQGYPQAGHPPTPYPPSGYQTPGYPPPGYPPPGYPPPGYGPPGYGPPGYGYRVVAGPVDVLGRPMADWWRRLLAYLLDAVILGIPWSIVIALTGLDSTTTTNNGATVTTTFTSGTWVGIGIGFLVVLGYFSFLDGSRSGQTLGKKVLDIAVRDISSGGPIGAGRALARRFVFFAFYFFLIVPFFINALSPLWDRRRQAWHDHIVRSCVIKVH